MSFLNNSLTTRLLVRILAIIGFADAVFLTTQHYLGEIPPCSVVEGCETVLTSPYATILGIPVALFGALFYLAILFKPSRLLAFLGFLASLTLLYLQLFVIKAICLYCLISLVTSTGIFITIFYAHYFGNGSKS